MKIKILHPGNEDFSQKPNEGSLVLELETSGIRGVFTGDLPVEEETGILEQISECDFLKAGHHGSDGSSSCELLDRVQPEISLISCGKNNRYGHPGRETLERLEQAGSRIFRTDRQGALILKKTKKGWAVTGYKISLAQSLAERYTEEKEMRRRT